MKHPPRPARALLVLVGLALVWRPSPADEAAQNFSATANPSGAWSWGFAPTLQGSFQRAPGYPSRTNLSAYRGAGNVTVGHNPTDKVQLSGTAVALPGELFMHPGEQGQYAVVRWTAPTAGVVRVQALFLRRDFAHPTTTDVHVLRAGRSIFSGALDADRRQVRFRSLVSVKPGTHLDFAVGSGANGNFEGDLTGAELRVDYEPAAGRLPVLPAASASSAPPPAAVR